MKLCKIKEIWYSACSQCQRFILIMTSTITDPTEQKEIYTDMVNQLRQEAFVTNDLKIKQKIRQRHNGTGNY